MESVYGRKVIPGSNPGPTARTMILKRKPRDFKPEFEVAACFCEHEGEILLLKRHPNKDYGGFWNLPAGKLGQGETAEDAVVREVREETGIALAPEQISRIGTYYDIYPEYSYLFHVFRASVGSKKVNVKEDEATDYGWFVPHDALKLNLVPDEDYCIIDAFKLRF